MHIDMDAFFASIEQAVNPRLKGKPLIVGSRGNKMHTVVCAASYEAKGLGIDSGTPTAEAFRLCPGLEFVVSDQSKYIWTSEQVFEMLKGYGFETNYASIDEFQLDIAGLSAPETLARDIQEKIHAKFDISASIGIAKNCLLAKLASKIDKPKGLVALNENNLKQVLTDTPAGRLCGIGASTQLLFEGLGIKTCLDLYLKSPQFLRAYLGKNGLNLYAGLHSNERLQPQQNDEKPKSIGHSYTLSRASQTLGFIRAWIRLLAEMVARRLRGRGLAARTVHLWLSGPEIGNFGSQKTFTEATNEADIIFLRAAGIMAKTGPKTPKIRALGVTCGNLSAVSYRAFLPQDKKKESLTKALDLINGRYGDWSIYPAIITQAKSR